jgi:hypothetical protein
MNDVEISPQDARAAYLRMVDGDPGPSREPLEAAYKARALARAQHQADSDALAIAKGAELKFADMGQRVEQGVLDKEDEAAAELAAQMLNGGAPVDITVDEKLALASAVAQSKAKLAKMAAVKLRERHAVSLQKLREADAAVAAAADAILDEELFATAKLLEFHLDEAARIGKALYFEVLGVAMATRRQVPELASRVVKRLDLPMIDRLNIANNLFKTGDLAAVERRKARHAEMISGESAPTADIAAA